MTKMFWDKTRPVGERWVPRENFSCPSGKSAHVMADISEFRSPIDGDVISSRSALREHEKVHEVRQCGNDWTGGEYHPKPDWFGQQE